MPLAIDVHDLSKSFGPVRAVKDVAIQVEQGHITGFLGPNGSGKTTTLRMLCALAAAVMHEPRLLLLDEPTAGVDPQARRDFWDEIHRLADEGMTVLVSTHYMDEAERCHDIAYIFAGELIARGTAEEVIAESRLVTFEAEGGRADRLGRELAGKPGVEMVAPFGAALHVSGTDRAKLEQAIRPFRREPYHWKEVAPSLEDVFIHLMREAGARSTVDEAA